VWSTDLRLIDRQYAWCHSARTHLEQVVLYLMDGLYVPCGISASHGFVYLFTGGGHLCQYVYNDVGRLIHKINIGLAFSWLRGDELGH